MYRLPPARYCETQPIVPLPALRAMPCGAMEEAYFEKLSIQDQCDVAVDTSKLPTQ